jgi:hypothetical protein
MLISFAIICSSFLRQSCSVRYSTSTIHPETRRTDLVNHRWLVGSRFRNVTPCLPLLSNNRRRIALSTLSIEKFLRRIDRIRFRCISDTRILHTRFRLIDLSNYHLRSSCISARFGLLPQLEFFSFVRTHRSLQRYIGK